MDGRSPWILNDPQRQRVGQMATIIARLDRQLKGQPAGWPDLYVDAGPAQRWRQTLL